MRSALRTIACYALVVSILGGLWAYAVLQQRIKSGERFTLPPADPAMLRHARQMAEEEERKEQQERTAAADQNSGVVSQVETGQ